MRTVVIPLERSLDEILKLLVLKTPPTISGPPRDSGGGLGRLLRRCSTVCARKRLRPAFCSWVPQHSPKEGALPSKQLISLLNLSQPPTGLAAEPKDRARPPAAACQTLNQDKQCRNNEDGNSCGGKHATDYSRTHSLTGHRTGTGSQPTAARQPKMNANEVIK